MAVTKAVLIIGGSGFVGSHLAFKLRDKHKVFLTYHKNQLWIPGVTSIPAAVSNRNWIKRIVYMAKPDVIIYAAGKNQVDWAEENSRECDQVHSHGPATVSNVSEILAPKFIYLSNSYIFDGNRGNYHETDIVFPSIALGKAKVGGENYIRGRSLNYLILRSSPLFGRSNGLNLSFLDRLRMSLEHGKRVSVDHHELHSFAPIDGFTETVARLVESGIRNKTFHYGGLTKITWAELGWCFAKRFSYDPALITPKRRITKTSREESMTYDYSLNSTQIIESLKIKPFLLEESFDLIEQKLIPKL